MGQVPKFEKRLAPHYLLMGSGRMALHMAHYLDLLNIPYLKWARNPHSRFNSSERDDPEQRLAEVTETVSHVLLLLSDDALDEFEGHHLLREKIVVHFSGAKSLKNFYSAHPLMSFTDELMPVDFYNSIPFIIEKGGPSLADLLPGLPNSSHAIPKNQKSLYHALCVSSGNFTNILWSSILERAEKELGLDRSLFFPYLNKIVRDIQSESLRRLTGPFVRGDMNTIKSNLKSLDGSPLQELYQSFFSFYSQSKESHL